MSNYTVTLLQNGILDPSYLYSDYGASLYNLIVQQPEYYLPELEKEIFIEYADEINDAVNTVVIEPGCGNAEKIKYISKSRMEYYFGIDIALGNVQAAEKSVSRYAPSVSYSIGCMNYLIDPIRLPDDLSCEHKTIFFPGSSIGNFSPSDTTRLLKLWSTNLVGGDNLIVAQDLFKDVEKIYRAYNDEAGVTARFVHGALNEANRRGNLALDTSAFQYVSVWDTERKCMMLGVVCIKPFNVDTPQGPIEFHDKQFVVVEECYKPTASEFIETVESAGYELKECWFDSGEHYGIFNFEVKKNDSNH